jgi:E3 ubiquitin-protein ligase RNF14
MIELPRSYSPEVQLFAPLALSPDGQHNMDDVDERQVEIETIQSIYPELIIDEQNPARATLELPVELAEPLPVVFVAANGSTPAEAEGVQGRVHPITYLPNLHVNITLPKGYPTEKPPAVTLATAPQWLPTETIHLLLEDVTRLWEELGRDQVLYAFIDHIQELSRSAFNLCNEKEGPLKLPAELEVELLDFDIQATKRVFDCRTYDCGVCLEPRRGIACHKLSSCGHIFCRQCFKDVYNNAIKEGDVGSVKCLDPGCAKRRAEPLAGTGRRRKPNVQLSPAELLQIGLDAEMVKRYLTMKHKLELEADKTTVYCPRKWCQGAARSKKHKKPILSPDVPGFGSPDETDDSDEEDESGMSDAAKKAALRNRANLVRICEDCGFAFCSRCLHSWHGEFVQCGPPRNTEELTEEEKASLEYIKLHTTPCPTCDSPAQKTMGCNHMICQRCETHFCYLCSAWLIPSNPYQHFNTRGSSCYERLWELEGGDGHDVGYAYHGGHNAVPAAEDPPAVDNADGHDEDEAEDAEPARERVAPLAPGIIQVEAPNILRVGLPPPRPVAPPVPQPHRQHDQRLGRHARAAARRAAEEAANAPRGFRAPRGEVPAAAAPQENLPEPIRQAVMAGIPLDELRIIIQEANPT